jgi:hypothetical protein
MSDFIETMINMTVFIKTYSTAKERIIVTRKAPRNA